MADAGQLNEAARFYYGLSIFFACPFQASCPLDARLNIGFFGIFLAAILVEYYFLSFRACPFHLCDNHRVGVVGFSCWRSDLRTSLGGALAPTLGIK